MDYPNIRRELITVRAKGGCLITAARREAALMALEEQLDVMLIYNDPDTGTRTGARFEPHNLLSCSTDDPEP